MVKIITMLSIFLVGILANAQVSETRNVASFTKVEIGNKIELVYTETTEPSVKVTAEDHQDLENLATETDGETLKIYMKKTWGNSGATIKVYVTGNGITAITAQTDAKVKVKNQLSAPEVAVTLKSGAYFLGIAKASEKITLKAEEGTICNLRAETKTFNGYFSEDAKINLSGTAVTATIKGSDRSLCLAKNFNADQLEVEASDYANLKMYANHNIDIKVDEFAKVAYSGNPSKIKMNESAVASDSKKVDRNTVAAN